MTQEEAIQEKASGYLRAAEAQCLIPNFWMSSEYILKKGLDWAVKSSLYGGFTDDSNRGVWFFPPMNIDDGLLIVGTLATYELGFLHGWYSNGSPTIPKGATFFDYQYIYNPVAFLNLDGGKWSTFRKNIRKYPHRHNGQLRYVPIHGKSYHAQVAKLLTTWAEDNIFYDNEVMIKFCLQGQNRKGLFLGNTLVGLNVWDENYQFINYRYCIDNRDPFLNEYLRWRFYTDPDIIAKQKFVNDGGSLDRDELKRFKMKLNPCRVGYVFSVPKGEPNESKKEVITRTT